MGRHLLAVRARFHLQVSPCSIPSGKNGIGAAFPPNTYFISGSRVLEKGGGRFKAAIARSVSPPTPVTDVRLMSRNGRYILHLRLMSRNGSSFE